MLKRVFGEGFRAFFLAAALWGMISGIIWLIALIAQMSGDGLSLSGPSMAPHLWHGHEMIFGYGTAAIGGFFLTAVPNWTGSPAVRERFIALAVGAWLAARVALWFSGFVPLIFVSLIDLAFVPILALRILMQLLKRPKPQNMIFLLFLLALFIANLLVHLDWHDKLPGGAGDGLRMGLLALCGMIAVLGGRVTPAFTRNAMNRAGLAETRFPATTPRLDKASMVLAVALPWAAVWTNLAAPVAALLALVQGARLVGWRGRWTLDKPILWSLHLGQGMLVIGLTLWALAKWGLGDEIAAMHFLGVGAVGVMTLAVMSRATLGHTGRPLHAPGPIAWGYVMMAVAAIARWLGGGGGMDGDYYYTLLFLTGGLWVLAFALFLFSLAGALTQPRPPRAPVPPVPDERPAGKSSKA
ncbi:NnrS family protein [Alisedimentitalea sp. MJ-SS2]|uniref:NnrS family protein n=1 Tax=Aliisedimentitalea sp. MJ-SS2 TaxID=3049795 RepID=UPI002908767E|nr:NnrS family protein [Alisedimentitalea sp. MJ-SS2]MDU8927183.1 NnrS family protein [Alisedimentitalea sp. MJ-SS2]